MADTRSAHPDSHLSPLAGKPAPKDLLIDVGALERAYYERRPDPGDPNQQVRLRHQRPPRHRRSTAPSPRRTSWRSPRRSATTGASRGSTARSTWARTRTRSPARPSAPRSRCSPPTASRRSSSETTASRRRRSSRTRSSSTTAAARRAPRRRHRHHAVAQPAGGRRLQVQPAERRPGRHRRHALDRGPRQRILLQAGNAGVKRVAVRRRRSTAATTHQRRLRPALRRGPGATSSTWRRSAAPASKLGVDPLGGAARATTGSRSTRSTAWTSPSSIRRSIRRSRS